MARPLVSRFKDVLAQPRTRVFLLITLLLALSHLAFVVLYAKHAEDALDRSVRERADKIRAAYEVALATSYTSLLELANLIARDPSVQSAFLAGRRAVEREGGPRGGAEAAAARDALLAAVRPRWSVLQERHGLRQLQFFLPPGDVAFLRVERPESFGLVHSASPIVLDTDVQRSDRVGFELDVLGAVHRAAVPVFSQGASERPEYIGALVVGQDFSLLFDVFDSQLDVGVGVVLNGERVAESVDPAVLSAAGTLNPAGDCFTQLSARYDADDLLRGLDGCGGLRGTGTRRLEVAGRELVVSWFPLREYAALRAGSADRVGSVLLWFDLGEESAAQRRSLMVVSTYAAVSLLLLGTLLFLLVRFGVRRFEQAIAERTREVQALNQELARVATTDDLTGLSTRAFFLRRVQESLERAERFGEPFCLVLLDLDHFKRINDGYGHLTGDRVLREVANLLNREIRSVDSAGRYGGEELCLSLAHTDWAGAAETAERLRRAIAELDLRADDGRRVQLTASLGVACWDGRGGIDDLVRRADRALYAAKGAGRNRVVLDRDLA